MIIKWRRPTHLVSRSKKIQIWYRRFGYASNAYIIQILKLLVGIGEFNIIYNLTKIYNNFEVFELEDNNPKPELELHIELNTKSNILEQITLQTSRVTNFEFNFNKICESCIESKQTYIIWW